MAVRERPASCHPERLVFARGACRACYQAAWERGTHIDFPAAQRGREEFAADYAVLRGRGLSRRRIAEEMGMTLAAVHAAYARAVRAGILTPDPPCNFTLRPVKFCS